MKRSSKICCPKCNWNLRRLTRDSSKRTDVPYECPFCKRKWLVTMGNGFYLTTIKPLTEEETIYA